MKLLTLSSAVALVLAASVPGAAMAEGCMKGAVVGGVAGHMAHHGVLGAAGGCAVGHHEAARREKQSEHQRYEQQRYEEHAGDPAYGSRQSRE